MKDRSLVAFNLVYRELVAQLGSGESFGDSSVALGKMLLHFAQIINVP